MLEGLKVMHSAKRAYWPQGTYADGDLKSMRIKVSEKALEERAHTCMRSHPESDRRILFVNWLYAVCFEGMTGEESAPVLDFLNRHSQRPELQIRFRWRQGSLALWDKHSTQHRGQRLSGLSLCNGSGDDRRRQTFLPGLSQAARDALRSQPAQTALLA